MKEKIGTEKEEALAKKLSDIILKTILQAQEKHLLSSDTLQEMINRSQEISVLFERWLARKNGRLVDVYFRRLRQSFVIESLSGICPHINFAQRIKLQQEPDLEADAVSILGGDDLPSSKIGLRVYEATRKMSLYQAFSRLMSNYRIAALNKGQIRYFCLKYQKFLQEKDRHVVFLLKKLFQEENGSDCLLAVIASINKNGLHIAITPTSSIVYPEEGKNYFFVVPYYSDNEGDES
jgi:hypothetical protein